MSSEPVYDPDWEPYRHVVKLRLTSTQLAVLDALVVELGMSRSRLMRKGLVAGLPGVVDELRAAMAKRFSLIGPRDRKRPTAARRGPRRNKGVEVWLHAAAHGLEMPRLELPESDED